MMEVMEQRYFVGTGHPGIGAREDLPMYVPTSEDAQRVAKLIREEGYNARIYLEVKTRIELPL